MIAVDTSIWIEFLRGREPVFSRLRLLLEEGEVMSPVCVFGELLQGAKDSEELELIEAYWKNLPKGDTERLFLEAGRLSAQKGWFDRGVGLIDALLIVFARTGGNRIWTLDKKLLSVLDPAERFEA